MDRSKLTVGVIIVIAIVAGAAFIFIGGERESESENIGDVESFGFESDTSVGDISEIVSPNLEDTEITMKKTISKTIARTSRREVTITDGTKHSIPLDEILGGGPQKDGIPSIDNPKFETSSTDLWLTIP